MLRGESQKNWVGICDLLSKTLKPIYEQNLRFSLPYLWPDEKFGILFMTKAAEKPYPLGPLTLL